MESAPFWLLLLIGCSAGTISGLIGIGGGIYRYSRNPMYASFSLVMLGTAVAAQSLFLLCMWTVTATCTHVLIIGEERYCLTNYGDSYRVYMKKTPRYCLLL